MTYSEYRRLFEKDENGRFVHLVIPASQSGPEIDLRGKLPSDFTVDEIIRMKKYSGQMYKTVDKTTVE